MKDDRFRIGLLLSPIANLAKNLPNALRERGDSSGQAILTFRLRAINVPLRQASKGHSRPLVAAKLAGNQAPTHDFKQFPS
jgi:hypothetical protein